MDQSSDIARRIAAALPRTSPDDERRMWQLFVADFYAHLASLSDVEIARLGRECEKSNAAFQDAVMSDFPFANIVVFGDDEVRRSFLDLARRPAKERRAALTRLATRLRNA